MTLRPCAAVIASALLLAACGSEEGPGGITAGMAVGKFCHQLRRTAGAIELTLEFGTPLPDGGTAPAGTVASSPGPTLRSLPSATKVHVLERISKDSSAKGWMCGATKKPWSPHAQLEARVLDVRHPDVSRKVILFPVTGCTIVWPLVAIAVPSFICCRRIPRSGC